MRLLWERTASESELPALGGVIASELTEPASFCMWLEGPLGAGKTNLCRYILQAIGLSPHIPVSSPTYSIINEYEISDKLYAHLDLYRIEGSFDIEDLGLVSERSVSGLFVEWPSKVEDELLSPTHQMKISKVGDDMSLRTYAFYKC
ncbi:MAG: tRNA (adenosine(37)-N6)-threonylcarbamoyltransferase complex ATPase subunit type 1 TsaE [Oligoflexales bacterium]|nr:tRNA (adenosine(37)-N6)-threonylcarbamoyltransferase complex ATPase subunit type 1 TsaE [Oligoflexales bacterium]